MKRQREPVSPKVQSSDNAAAAPRDIDVSPYAFQDAMMLVKITSRRQATFPFGRWMLRKPAPAITSSWLAT